MQKISLAVFDMAGTVVNEDNVVYKTLQKAINAKGYFTTLEYVLEHGAGKEKHQAIKDILSQSDALDVEEESALIFKDFKKLLEKAYLNLEVTSFDGVVDLLRFLKDKNVQIALNTGYDRNTAQLLLNKMNWKLGKEFDVLVTADDVLRGRPNPDMIYEAMNSLGISDPQEVLKAGDSIIDIEEGRNANCGITVGVTTGAHTKNQLESARPTFVVEHLIQLQALLFK